MDGWVIAGVIITGIGVIVAILQFFRTPKATPATRPPKPTTTDWSRILRQAENLPLSKSLPIVLEAAVQSHDEDLTSWARLELLGYLKENPAMTEKTIVPTYRTVRGQWFDTYGRPVRTDPRLAFVNEARLREGVHELEVLASRPGMCGLPRPDEATSIRETFHTDVNEFRFDSRSISQVLASIKAQLMDYLANRPLTQG